MSLVGYERGSLHGPPIYEGEEMKNVYNDPLAFACPSCGECVAVTHVDGETDIFHMKPLCAAFDARDREYQIEVLRLDQVQRAK